jgi:uncharacterized protein YyaL (SSP411 family)
MNRLANETSPYLLQHAQNPVDWFPWGEEAFARAHAEDKPVFLSIGYAACHWCHVMERESFENEQIARFLNDHFVSIKVDREERPDVDSIYMQAVQLMTSHGGWPMSIFLTPDAQPFYAGTYFPPADRHGMPGFGRVLAHVSEAYRTRREEVQEASQEVTNAIGASLVGRPGLSPAPSIDRAALENAAARIAESYDAAHGGFGGAPKFPPSMTLDFLMQRGGYDAIITNTLTKMARGGIYDQIGGGFHRYSTDAQWLVPHFEKMLYDNALLARLYTRAWQWSGNPLFARVANEILGFVEREMTSPGGGFYSTLDADSEGEEGKFYVWSRAEVMDVLGPEEGKIFCDIYDITERGNWEGKNIPNIPGDAEYTGDGKRKLYDIRSQRVWPARDEKILTGWNGWMLAAFAEACLAFDRYHDRVRHNAEFLLTRADAAGRVMRTEKIAGLLEDYTGFAWGLTLAYEALHERRYLDAARRAMEQVLERFADENGGFFDTPVDHEKLITRPKDLFDNATPSGNSVAADVLLRLAILFAEERYARAATRAIDSVWPLVERYPSGFGFLLGVAEWRAGQPKEIAITGPAGDPAFRALRAVVGETFLPHRVLVAGEGSSDLPLMENRATDRVMAYVCEAYACQEPTRDPERLRALLHPSP